MGSLFNFYQDTGYGTGQHAPTYPIDFFTGHYYPSNIELGGDAGFSWPLGEYVRPIEQAIGVSGSLIDGKTVSVSFGSKIYGFISPLITDTVSFGTSMSGSAISGQRDTVLFSTSFKSSGIHDNIDINNLKISWTSGMTRQDNRDIANFSCKLSGSIASGIIDAPSFGVSFWASFTPRTVGDDAIIQMSMYDVTYTNEPYSTVVSGATGTNLSLRLINVLYTNA